MQRQQALAETEKNYSNIELLAACWSLEKSHHYIYVSLIETDHEPLEGIWKRSIVSASLRLQRLLLRMTKYDVNIMYITGDTNVVADALSRVCFREDPSTQMMSSPIEVNTITRQLPATPLKLQQVRDATHKDDTLYNYPQGSTACNP